MVVRPFKVSSPYLYMLYVFYFFGLAGVYIFGIGPVYEYMGFMVSVNADKIFLSLVALFLMFPFLRQNATPSCFFLNMSAVLIFVPSLVLYSCSDLPHYFAIVTTLACFVVALTSKSLCMHAFRMPTVTSLALYRAMSISAVLVIIAIVVLGGVKNINFNIMAVYEFREGAAESLPGAFGYLNSIVTKVFVPFAIVFAIVNRRWFGLVVLVAISVLFFALTSHKSPLFYPVVVVFIYYIARVRNAPLLMLYGVGFVIVISVVDIFALSHQWGGYSGIFSSLFARRVILIPSLLNWFYLDFFEEMARINWANSKFTLGLVASPYDLTAPKLIGFEYFNRDEMSANTGWIGSGYANAGVLGVLIYSFLIGVLFSFLDAYSNRLGVRVVTAMFALPVFTLLTSTDLATMLITHGLAVSVLVLMVARPMAHDKVV